MMKYKLLFLLTLCFVFTISAQNKREREHRIRKIQFPEKALHNIKKELANVKRIRFYKEIDSNEVRYIAKFKKDRLKYGIQCDVDGNLKSIEFNIQSVDIPEDTYKEMSQYLKGHFSKYKIRKMKQQYLITNREDVEATVESAFQNLILPLIRYELIVTGKAKDSYELYIAHFDAVGNLQVIKESLPPNYDRVLY